MRKEANHASADGPFLEDLNTFPLLIRAFLPTSAVLQAYLALQHPRFVRLQQLSSGLQSISPWLASGLHKITATSDVKAEPVLLNQAKIAVFTGCSPGCRARMIIAPTHVNVPARGGETSINGDATPKLWTITFHAASSSSP